MSIYWLIAAIATTPITPPPVGTPPAIYVPSVISAPPRGKESPPIPKGNPGEWVNTDDYPAAALQEKREGITAFRVGIGRDGRVTTCEVTVSSGHADLDNATCQHVTERAIFTPALDRKGKAITSTYANRVRWQIPENPLNIPDPGVWTFTYTIEKDGTVSECKIAGPGVDERPDPCKYLPTFVPPLNKNGEAVRKRIVTSTATRVGDLAEPE